ncbi:MAG: hypothetical protein M3024_00505 [Candidatus Dormibacteraeota bacterium]|nr:hypothetical protein [Candidatus Dormibacteraeota bacterium]
MYLSGEWVMAAVGLAIPMVVALVGVVGLGYWVLRGENRNRAREQTDDSRAGQGN